MQFILTKDFLTELKISLWFFEDTESKHQQYSFSLKSAYTSLFE